MEVNNSSEIEEVKNLTIVERFKYFFTNPNKLFGEYKIKPTWLVKLLIICAISIIYTILLKNLTFGPQVDMIIQQTPDMSKEQAEATIAFMNSPAMTGIAVGAALVMAVIAVFLTPLIYYGLIALFGGKTSYMRVVAVYTLAYIPYYIGELASLAFAYFTNNYESLLQPQLMDVMFNRLGLFVIWQVLLLVFGFSKIAGLKLSKSAIIVAIMWIIATGISLIPVFMNRMF
ncbi:MAG: hypothetical protein A2Y23_11650 [Clostridiales bacterium GWB2_37_7]|nr:MAG: hypothetical protein A2Y23_11650 [Clostridiales bacterium GWB2_37_7]